MERVIDPKIFPCVCPCPFSLCSVRELCAKFCEGRPIQNRYYNKHLEPTRPRRCKIKAGAIQSIALKVESSYDELSKTRNERRQHEGRTGSRDPGSGTTGGSGREPPLMYIR